MSVDIAEIKSKKELRSFIRFPATLYRKNPCWVPPLIFDEMRTLLAEKNPAFEFCEAKYWLARRGGTLVGRIAGIINWQHIERWHHKCARFGWFDFIDDEEVSRSLLETVEQWTLAHGLDAVHGPLGFCDMDREGMLIEGFDEVGTMATLYNHPYYAIHLERLGYTKDADWVEFHIRVPTEIPEKADRIARMVVEKRNVHVLAAKKSKDLLPYAHQIFHLINETYSGFYGFVPLTKKQIDFYVKQYFPLVNPDYVKVLLDENDKLAGFVIGMPSLSRALQRTKGKLFPFGFLHILLALKFPKHLDLYLGAIRPDLQGKGADALLMTEITKSCIKNHIVSAESNPELEDNLRVQGHWKSFDSRQHKRRRCYIKHLRTPAESAFST